MRDICKNVKVMSRGIQRTKLIMGAARTEIAKMLDDTSPGYEPVRIWLNKTYFLRIRAIKALGITVKIYSSICTEDQEDIDGCTSATYEDAQVDVLYLLNCYS